MKANRESELAVKLLIAKISFESTCARAPLCASNSVSHWSCRVSINLKLIAAWFKRRKKIPVGCTRLRLRFCCSSNHPVVDLCVDYDCFPPPLLSNIRVLLDEGKANTSIRNKSKQTPAELALKQVIRSAIHARKRH